MKALTIYQPWATLIALEAKPYEFRGWDYATRYRDLEGARIAIHASARPVKYFEIKDLVERMRGHQDKRVRESTGLPEHARPILERILAGMEGKGDPFPLPRGAIVCVSTLGRARDAHALFGRSINDSNRDEHALFAWPMIAVRSTAPIDCRGAQGFWNVPAAIEREISFLEVTKK